jgi:lipopolysaccharide/colanic/teichoic acid biosynthesis glycosyltransferase
MDLKRMFDFVGALTGLLLLGPLLLVLAVIVWTSSGRPVFFRQTRVGWRGRDFTLLKFRSMSVLPETERDRFEIGSFRRVTPVGRLLRKTKLDELPQLWNVLKGEMSLVGPRPEVRKWVDRYPERWARVLTVRPGITDPASITYRNEEEILARSPDPERTYREVILPHKLDLYETYVQQRGLRGDLGVLFQTVWIVVRG